MSKIKFHLTISVLNQAAVAVTNYCLTIYLLNILSVENFGLYGIYFAVVLFLSGIGNALFGTPLTVAIPQERKGEFGANILAVIITLVAILALTLVSIFEFFFIATEYKRLFYIIFFTSTSLLLKDFITRFCIAINKTIYALTMNLIIFFSLIVIIFLNNNFAYIEDELSALYVIGCINLLTIFPITFLLKLFKFNPKLIFSDFLLIKNNGFWSTLSHIFMNIRGQAHIYISALVLGPTAIAQMNAARLFVAPFMLLIPGINFAFLPKLSKEFDYYHNKLKKTYFVFYVCIILYTLLLIPTSNYIFSVIAQDQSGYENISTLVLIWCAILLSVFFRSQNEISLQSRSEFKFISHMNFLLSLASLIVIYLFSTIFFVAGALIGLLIIELILGFSLYSYFRKKIHGNSS